APASASVSASPQKKGKDTGKESKNEKKSKGESAAPTKAGVQALWEDRGDISKLNMVLGIGSETGKPRPPFQFDKSDNQIRDAFRAAGAMQAETDGFATQIRKRINEIQAAVK